LETQIIHKKFTKQRAVKRILVVRLQAIGDVALTLPYVQDLRNKLPENTRIDLLVRKEAENIPKHLTLFDNVYSLSGGRNTKKQFFFFLLLLPRLLGNRYDVFIDLQNHKLTKWMRFLLQIKAYAIFDKVSSNYAGDRYRNTINALGFVKVEFTPLTSIRKINEPALFQKFNLSHETEYIVINPAGAFVNRNWSVDHYVDFCMQWHNTINKNTKFLILGLDKISEKAAYLERKLGSLLINLVGKTEFIDALYILKKVRLVVSEDSGLMHLSYVLGVPTLGILGSTRSDWVNPKSPHTHFFTSSDLPCGDCMLEVCKFEDVKCLARVKPEHVINASLELLNRSYIPVN